METTKRITVTVEKQYAELLNSLPNKSIVVSNLIALLLSNADENDLMRIAYASSHSETLRQELKKILQRNIEIEMPTQTDKVKTSKTSKQTSKEKESKDKEAYSKKSISVESWESWW